MSERLPEARLPDWIGDESSGMKPKELEDKSRIKQSELTVRQVNSTEFKVNSSSQFVQRLDIYQ